MSGKPEKLALLETGDRKQVSGRVAAASVHRNWPPSNGHCDRFKWTNNALGECRFNYCSRLVAARKRERADDKTTCFSEALIISRLIRVRPELTTSGMDFHGRKPN